MKKSTKIILAFLIAVTCFSSASAYKVYCPQAIFCEIKDEIIKCEPSSDDFQFDGGFYPYGDYGFVGVKADLTGSLLARCIYHDTFGSFVELIALHKIYPSLQESGHKWLNESHHRMACKGMSYECPLTSESQKVSDKK